MLPLATTKSQVVLRARAVGLDAAGALLLPRAGPAHRVHRRAHPASRRAPFARDLAHERDASRPAAHAACQPDSARSDASEAAASRVGHHCRQSHSPLPLPHDRAAPARLQSRERLRPPLPHRTRLFAHRACARRRLQYACGSLGNSRGTLRAGKLGERELLCHLPSQRVTDELGTCTLLYEHCASCSSPLPPAPNGRTGVRLDALQGVQTQRVRLARAMPPPAMPSPAALDHAGRCDVLSQALLGS